ncbi:Protein of unknown function [Leuconostoc citreum LBAE C10]|nr:Protein of unknown function [Leuconostoc citreum LBAE C10]
MSMTAERIKLLREQKTNPTRISE